MCQEMGRSSRCHQSLECQAEEWALPCPALKGSAGSWGRARHRKRANAIFLVSGKREARETPERPVFRSGAKAGAAEKSARHRLEASAGGWSEMQGGGCLKRWVRVLLDIEWGEGNVLDHSRIAY